MKTSFLTCPFQTKLNNFALQHGKSKFLLLLFSLQFPFSSFPFSLLNEETTNI